MAPYMYAPLSETAEIRLVQLHAASFDDPIQISIIKKPFTPPPPEEAEKRLAQAEKTLPDG
jgi:hypothetical protein